MLTTIFPIISTRDLRAALAFYRDLLGATVGYEFPGPDGEPGYVGLELGAAHLGIARDPAAGRETDARISLWVYADDCDAAELHDGGEADDDDEGAQRRRRQAAAEARAELAAGDRADGDQRAALPATSATSANTSPATGSRAREHVLERVDALEVVGQRQAEDREQQDPLRRAEVAAVDAGAEDRRERPAPRAGRRVRGARRARRVRRGWRTTSTSAITMNTGTIASNAESGSSSSATAPRTPPVSDARLSRSSRRRCPSSSRR